MTTKSYEIFSRTGIRPQAVTSAINIYLPEQVADKNFDYQIKGAGERPQCIVATLKEYDSSYIHAGESQKYFFLFLT
jgi:hypothetical protein